MYGGWCEVGKAGSVVCGEDGLRRDEKVDYSGVCKDNPFTLIQIKSGRILHVTMIHYSKSSIVVDLVSFLLYKRSIHGGGHVPTIQMLQRKYNMAPYLLRSGRPHNAGLPKIATIFVLTQFGPTLLFFVIDVVCIMTPLVAGKKAVKS
jgi:hypothetical protein